MNKVEIVEKLIYLIEGLIKESELVDTDTELDYFVNPTLQELDTIESGHVRFIADDNSKQLYVWDAYNKIHEDAMRDLGMQYSDLLKPEKVMYLSGWMRKKGSMFAIESADKLEYYIAITKVVFGGNKELVDVVDKIINTDWTWIENYSIKNVGSYMSSLKNSWEKIKSDLKI